MPSTLTKHYTAEDLWELSHRPEFAGSRLELDQGELVVMAPTGGEHGGYANTIGFFITAFARQNKLGHVTAAETGYHLGQTGDGKDIVRGPAAAFVNYDRLRVLRAGYIPLAPDLAIEVVSPNDSADDLQKKVAEDFEFGTTLVWVIYPKLRQLVVHTPDGSRILTAADTLDGGDVLPGFSLLLDEVFTG